MNGARIARFCRAMRQATRLAGPATGANGMHMDTIRKPLARCIGALLACAAAPVFAQAIPAADFAKRQEAWGATLSPTGEYAALEVPVKDGLETQLQIVKLDGSGDTKVLRFRSQQHVSDVIWTADDRVVVSPARLQPLKEAPASYGELMTSDINGKNQDTLFGYIPDSGNLRGKRKDTGWSVVTEVLDAEPGMALVDFTCWDCGEDPDSVIFKVDTLTGSRTEIERVDGRAHFEFDRTGEGRFRTTWNDEDEPILHYRPAKGSAWTPLPESIAGRLIYGTQFDPDNNVVYALVTDAGEPAQAYRIDLAAGTRTKLAGRDDVSMSGFMLEGRNGSPFAVLSFADKPSVQYIKPQSEWAQLHAGLMKSFPGMMVSFSGVSRDNDKVMFRTWSDRDAGSVYIYERAAKKVQKLMDSRPWLPAARMASMKPIAFTARDGGKVYGFYTAPAGPGPHPLVVLPHGGPYEVSDSWGFDEEVQFLASRGYAVLQVNYRGSSGRGESYVQAGWKGWGTKIQDDITDAVKWTIDQKMTDANRICLFGASFGGYSALVQPVLNPGMYKCAIGYVGVYDLPLMRKTDNRNGQSDATERFFARTLGTDDVALGKVSPALRAGDIKVPVMLVHGKDDKTADFNQFKVMEAALKAAGNPAQVMLADGEGHGFVKPENRAEMYRKMEACLAKYIGPGAK